MYSVVQTQNDRGENEISVVPNNWLIGDTAMYWPGGLSITSMIQKQKAPQSDWLKFDCVILSRDIGMLWKDDQRLYFFNLFDVGYQLLSKRPIKSASGVLNMLTPNRSTKPSPKKAESENIRVNSSRNCYQTSMIRLMPKKVNNYIF